MQMRGGVERGLIRRAVLGKRMFVKKTGQNMDGRAPTCIETTTTVRNPMESIKRTCIFSTSSDMEDRLAVKMASDLHEWHINLHLRIKGFRTTPLSSQSATVSFPPKDSLRHTVHIPVPTSHSSMETEERDTHTSWSICCSPRIHVSLSCGEERET